MKQVVAFVLLCWCLHVSLQAQTVAFPLPEVPKLLTTPTDRANYLLDKDQRIILKNATVPRLEQVLEQLK